MLSVDEIVDAEQPGSQQPEEFGQIPTLGPPYISDWVILPEFFVVRVVTPGTVRATEEQLDFFVIERRTRQSQTNVADDDDAAAVAKPRWCAPHGIITRCGGREQHGVGAEVGQL